NITIKPKSFDKIARVGTIGSLCSSCHYAAYAQDRTFIIPNTSDGDSIYDLDDMIDKWEEYQKRDEAR
ncbi:MAG: hypothetical protein ACFFDQ_03685, partial [Candidatus Thorarchaeota archaeon]